MPWQIHDALMMDNKVVVNYARVSLRRACADGFELCHTNPLGGYSLAMEVDPSHRKIKEHIS